MIAVRREQKVHPGPNLEEVERELSPLSAFLRVSDDCPMISGRLTIRTIQNALLLRS